LVASNSNSLAKHLCYSMHKLLAILWHILAAFEEHLTGGLINELYVGRLLVFQRVNAHCDNWLFFGSLNEHLCLLVAIKEGATFLLLSEALIGSDHKEGAKDYHNFQTNVV
jgi:hypothetical protein